MPHHLLMMASDFVMNTHNDITMIVDNLLFCFACLPLSSMHFSTVGISIPLMVWQSHGIQCKAPLFACANGTRPAKLVSSQMLTDSIAYELTWNRILFGKQVRIPSAVPLSSSHAISRRRSTCKKTFPNNTVTRKVVAIRSTWWCNVVQLKSRFGTESLNYCTFHLHTAEIKHGET